MYLPHFIIEVDTIKVVGFWVFWATKSLVDEKKRSKWLFHFAVLTILLCVSDMIIVCLFCFTYVWRWTKSEICSEDTLTGHAFRNLCCLVSKEYTWKDHFNNQSGIIDQLVSRRVEHLKKISSNATFVLL